MKKINLAWLLSGIASVTVGSVFIRYRPETPGDAAAWVQAVGSIVAILASVSIVQWQHGLARDAAESLASNRRLKYVLSATLVAEELSRLLEMVAKLIRDTKSIGDSFRSAHASISDAMQSVRTLDVVEFSDDDIVHVAELRRAIMSLNTLASHVIAVGDPAVGHEPTLAVVEGMSRKITQAWEGLAKSVERD